MSQAKIDKIECNGKVIFPINLVMEIIPGTCTPMFNIDGNEWVKVNEDLNKILNYMNYKPGDIVGIKWHLLKENESKAA
jgi:hypothetical protein